MGKNNLTATPPLPFTHPRHYEYFDGLAHFVSRSATKMVIKPSFFFTNSYERKKVMKKEVDKHMIEEIILYVENDRDIYFSTLIPIEKNASRKIDKGIWDNEKGVKLFVYAIEAGLKKYAKEFGGKWFTYLSVKERKAAARILMENFLSDR